MKIKLVGKNLEDIRPLLSRYGFEEAEREFELVIAHGGDGALLGAEREAPPSCARNTAANCSWRRSGAAKRR